MFGANSNIFSGASSGLKKGLQYDVEWAAMVRKAVKSGNKDMIEDCIGVMDKFLSEVADERLVVKDSAVNALIGSALGLSHDPFAGSRELVHAMERRWGKP